MKTASAQSFVQLKKSTLSERAKGVGLESAAELACITSTSKETLTNWLKYKPVLFEVVLRGAVSMKVQEDEGFQVACDAARYRYLRPRVLPAFLFGVSLEDLDDAIDKAMAVQS